MVEGAELLRMLVNMEDVQASFLIMRLSISTRLTFLRYDRGGGSNQSGVGEP